MENNKQDKLEFEKIVIDLYTTQDVSITELAERFSQDDASYLEIDKMRKKISRILNSHGFTSIPLRSTEEYVQASKRKVKKSRFYIVTSQQNNTPIDNKAWESIKAYAEYLDAELLVVLGVYNSNKLINVHWDEATKDYWIAGNFDIGKSLTVKGKIQVAYTNKKPLNGINDLSSDKSICVVHPKLHSNSHPTLQGYDTRRTFTTGSISKPNYRNSVSGEHSLAKHKISFTVIEILKGGNFIHRQIELIDGDFNDLVMSSENSKVISSYPVQALILGDLHLRHLSKRNAKSIKSMIELVSPCFTVLHDAFDGETINFHLMNAPTKKAKLYAGRNSVKIVDEIDELKDYIKNLNVDVIVPQANHNERLDRALELDWRLDIINHDFYLKYIPLAVEDKLPRGVLAHAFETDDSINNVTFLSHLDSFKAGKYELAHHGHFGINGARGSVSSYIKLNIPIILGHTHSELRSDDCIYVGSNTKKLIGYNERGASSWTVANAVVTSNGAAILCPVIDGIFTLIKNNLR